MVWVGTAIAAVGFVSSLFGASKQRGAAKDAKALGRENAAFIALESAEEARRLKLSQEQTTGTAKLGIAASGFRSGKQSMGASHKKYLADLGNVQEAELAWLEKSSLSRQKIAEMGGQMQSKQMMAASYQSLAGAASSGFQAYQTYKSG